MKRSCRQCSRAWFNSSDAVGVNVGITIYQMKWISKQSLVDQKPLSYIIPGFEAKLRVCEKVTDWRESRKALLIANCAMIK